MAKSRWSAALAALFILGTQGPAGAQTSMFQSGPDRLGREQASDLAFVTDEAWAVQTDGPIRSKPLVHRGVVVFGGDDMRIRGVDEATGRVLWTVEAGAAVGGSALGVDGVAYVMSNDNALFAIDVADGRVRWRRDLGANLPHRGFWDFFASTPAFADGVLYVGSGDGGIYALDAATGATRWRFATGRRVRSSPAIVGNALVAGSFDGHVYRLDRRTGKEVWRFATEGVGFDYDKYGFDRTSVQSSPAIKDGVVVIGSRDGRLYGIDFATGKERWKIRYGAPWVVSTPLLHEGRAIVGSSDGLFVTGVDYVTGKELWRTEIGARVISSLILLDGLVIANSEDGYIQALEPATGKVAWRRKLDGKTFGTPALGNGLILAGDNSGRLHAFRARGRAAAAGRFVYLDVQKGYHNWDPKFLEAARDRLAAAGYAPVLYEGLEAHLRAEIASGRPGVLVFLGEQMPKAVRDRAAGAPLFRQFMEAGGRIVSIDPWPGAIHYDDKGEPQYDPEAPGALTGIPVDKQSFEETRSVPTAAGAAWGLSGWSMSAAGAEPGAVDEVLAIGGDGYAQGFVKRVGKGAFVRAPAAQNEAPDADVLLTFAEKAAAM